MERADTRHSARNPGLFLEVGDSCGKHLHPQACFPYFVYRHGAFLPVMANPELVQAFERHHVGSTQALRHANDDGVISIRNWHGPGSQSANPFLYVTQTRRGDALSLSLAIGDAYNSGGHTVSHRLYA